uniref:Peptidase M16 N-terminal domain-containing protein n=1 Tax=Globodera rostochiensis TaxID=31243 RepID=A0A914IEX5_GLORO
MLRHGASALLSSQSRRGLTAAATSSAKPNPVGEPVQQKTSRLPNGLNVSSVDLQGATSQLVFAFRSGSRYEQHDEAGLTHQLRNAIGTDSTNYLGIRLLWVTGQSGASLETKLSKDLLLVQMTVTRTMSPIAISILGEFIQPALKSWDVLNVQQKMEYDLKQQSPYELIVEGAYRAAFRNGPLANPLLSSAHQIGNISNKRTQQFIKSRWLAGEAALIGVNIDHGMLLDYAIEHSVIPDGKGQPTDASPYLGGEVHQAGPGTLAHVALVGQGAKLTDEKAVAVQAVLCAAIGQTGHYTDNANIAQPGVVAQHVFKASNHNAFELSPISLIHADTGIVGVYLMAEGTKLFPYVKALAQGLRDMASKPLNADTLQIAKRTVELQTLAASADSANLAVDHASQVLAKGSASTPREFVQLVNGVTGEDVKKAAAQLCSKLSLSTYGKVNQVPYLDQL